MSVNYFARNSGAGMAAPMLWVPGKIAFFLQENLHAHKFLVLGGGYFGLFGLFGGGGASAAFIFMGARIFLSNPSGPGAGNESPLHIDVLCS